jgi:pimeloyl-ACP methyl ester carboxylesterase
MSDDGLPPHSPLLPAPPHWYDRALNSPSERGATNVHGVSINYQVWGAEDRPGVVLIHGSNANLEWWRFVAPFLARNFRVAAFDLSGNGDSGWRERYTGELFAEETMAVCRAAKLGDRPFVVGHSFGGFVALETGYRYDAELGGVVLADFTVNPPERYLEWGLRADREGKTRRATRVYDDLETALDRFRFVPEQPVRHPQVFAYIARQCLRQVEGGWTWKFDPSLFDHLEMGVDQCDKFIAMKCRSALILGEFSEDEGAQGADYMAELCDGALPVIELPDTYHHMTFDDPLALSAAIQGLLQAWLQQDQLNRRS